MKTTDTSFIERELGQFKRKYWLAKLLQGLLVFAGTGLVLVGLIALVEYFSWLSVIQRTFVFWALIAVELSLLGIYILWPLYQLLVNGKALSDDKAAGVIGSTIEGVNDRLLNYLELKKQAHDSELIDAGINQKQLALSVFSFKDAVRFSTLKPFLLFLIPVFVLLVFVWSGNRWFMLAEGVDRLVNYSTPYQKQLPFTIHINQDLEVIEGDDFQLLVSISGDVIPDEIVLKAAANRSVLSRQNGNEFVVTFQNCVHDVPFKFGFDDVFSKEYVLEVRKKALVGRVSLNVTPPAYTNISPFVIENSSAIEVPQFSKMEAIYAFKNTPFLSGRLVSSNISDTFKIENGVPVLFEANKQARLSAFVNDIELSNVDVKVIIDRRPELDVKVDSTEDGLVLFVGANDDYAIKNARALFVDDKEEESAIALPWQGALLKSRIVLSRVEIQALSKIKVQVFDEKGFTLRTIDLAKYKSKEQTESELLDNAGSNIDAMAKEEKDRKSSSSKSKKEQQKKAEQIQKAAKELSKKDSVLFERFEELSEEILKLTEKLNKDLPEAQKQITEKKLEDKIAELEKEWMILQTIEQLKGVEDSLAKSDKAIDKKQMEDLQKSAEKLENELKEDKKENDVDWNKFDELQKKNDELEQSESDEEPSSDANPKEAPSKSPSDLKEEMKKDSESLRQQLSKMSDIMMSEAAEKNIALLRRLELRALKNSKKQEEIYDLTKERMEIDKKSQIVQKEVNQSATSILDSLSALTVNDAMMAQALGEYQSKLEENLSEMADSETDDIRNYISNQRYLQYGLNDLAAFLYDILKVESQNMMDMKSGNKSCNNPKPGKGKKPSLSGQQKKLGEKMGKAGSKPGKGKDGKQSLSQSEVLELIKGQEAIIEQYEQKGGSKSGDGELGEELNKQLEDLINMNLDKALERNKDIEDKLIALEESENKKEDQKEERESKESDLDYDSIKKSIVEDYLRSSQRGTSIVNLPALKNYYTGKWLEVNQE